MKSRSSTNTADLPPNAFMNLCFRGLLLPWADILLFDRHARSRASWAYTTGSGADLPLLLLLLLAVEVSPSATDDDTGEVFRTRDNKPPLVLLLLASPPRSRMADDILLRLLLLSPL